MSELSSRRRRDQGEALRLARLVLDEGAVAAANAIVDALDAARAEAWGEGFEACKAITIAIGQRARDDIAEIVRKSEERTTDE